MIRRHMDAERTFMKFQISTINEAERWIYITTGDSRDFQEPDSFIHFVKKATGRVNGKIAEVGLYQYRITGDKIDLIYQWDSCFGIVIIYPEDVGQANVLSYIQELL